MRETKAGLTALIRANVLRVKSVDATPDTRADIKTEPTLIIFVPDWWLSTNAVVHAIREGCQVTAQLQHPLHARSVRQAFFISMPIREQERSRV